MKKTLILVVFATGLALTGIAFVTAADAFAQTVDAGVMLDAGVGSGSGSAMPADVLDDPVTNPAAAFDDAKAMHKLGWPLLLLASLIMIAKGLLTAGKRWSWSWLKWLNTGVRAVAIAGVITVASAAFNTLALGGTYFAVMVAAAGALFTMIAPTPKPVETP